jgi:MFS transporter, DHA1 family, tetracycline resistance protein
VPRLVPRAGEARLVRTGLVVQAIAFAMLGLSPLMGGAARAGLWTAAALIALGSGLQSPCLPAYVSRRAAETGQGTTLGALQSAGALARSVGPLVGGALYAVVAPGAPYLVGAAGFGLAALLALARLR